MEITKHLGKLGFKCKDKVTGSEGVITSISFDLYGCVQAVVTPLVDKDGKISDGHWRDIARLEIKGKKPVMDQPNFEMGYVAEGKKGAAEKPA